MTESEKKPEAGPPTFDISKVLAMVDFALGACQSNLATIQVQLSGLKVWLAHYNVSQLMAPGQGAVPDSEGEVDELLEQATPEQRMEALKQNLSGLARIGLISHDQALRWWEDWKQHQPQPDRTD